MEIAEFPPTLLSRLGITLGDLGLGRMQSFRHCSMPSHNGIRATTANENVTLINLQQGLLFKEILGSTTVDGDSLEFCFGRGGGSTTIAPHFD